MVVATVTALAALALQPMGVGQADGGASAVDGGASMRPHRGASSIFDAPSAAETGSAEWQAATEGIVRDMRAHLERRKTNADADLIRSNRGPIIKGVLRLLDFVRSPALGNVFRSLGLFLGAWVWYVFNTNTYLPPEYDD